MSRHGLALAVMAVVALAALAEAFPAASRGRRVARSAHASYYPDLYIQPQPQQQQQQPQPHPQGSASASTPYLYPDDYDYDQDGDYEQWWDSAASDTAANAAFLQNLMEANQLNERLDRMGLGQGQGLGLGQDLGLAAVLPPYSPRYLDPRYRDSDDYVFGSVNAGTTSMSSGSSGRAYEPAYGRYQYRVDQEEDDDDVRDLHALAKKSRTEEQRLQDLETQALIKAALGRQRDRVDREEQTRRGEFDNEASDQLDQELEKLFAKSGIANMYRGQEPKPWNGRDPIWNGYYMGTLEDTMPQRATRSKGQQYQYLQAPASTKAPVPVPAPAAAAATTARTPAPAATTTTTPSTTTAAAKATPPTPAPMKRMLGVGQRSGQPEVAMFRPAVPRLVPRPAVRATQHRAASQRPAIHHQGGVDEIRNLLRVQDTMGPRNADLLSLLPTVSKRSVAIVADEGSLVDELSALKKKAN